MDPLASHAERLRDNISGLIDLCRDIITDAQTKGFSSINVGLVDIASAALKDWDANELVTSFIGKSYPYWESIRLRDEEFFRENMATIFADVPLIDMGAVTRLLRSDDPKTGSPLVPDGDRDAVWDFLGAMVKICIKHIHNERRPCLHRVGNEYKPFYQRKAFPELKLEQQAKHWGIQLEFS